MLYDPESTLLDARSRYFEINDFKDGGYDERWVKMKAGPIPIAFPNTKARVRAVKFHDLHHVLTEYPTTWTGEAQIGAWEIATGCADHYPAWLLNFYAFAIGLVISPATTYLAFVRGRHSSNLYRRVFDEKLLTHKVGTMRRELRLSEPRIRATRRDKLDFVWWSLISIFAGLLTDLLIIAPLVVLLLILLQA